MTKIHEFDPQIYPCKIWVGKNVKYAEAIKKFHFADQVGNMIDATEEEYNGSGNNIARTFIVFDRKKQQTGLFVNLMKLKLCGINTITHESCHCADYIAEMTEFPIRTFENGEPYAYLCGWIAECINKVKK